MILEGYTFVLILSGISFIIPLSAILIGYFLGPRRPDAVKNDTYESGVETIGDTWVQFRAQYYLIGLIFLIFDVEVIFLFPIALAYSGEDFGLFAVASTITFVLILLLGLLLEWRKGSLEWE